MRFSDMVWSAPRGVKSRFALKDVYPDLVDFFCLQLEVNNPPHQDLLVDEIKLIAKEWGTRPLSEVIKIQTVDILVDISRILEKHDTLNTTMVETCLR